VGVVFRALATALPSPANYATGLAVFQIFFVPTALMYYLASRTSPADITGVHELLARRATGGPETDTDHGHAPPKLETST
jgi:hypothetical protein